MRPAAPLIATRVAIVLSFQKINHQGAKNAKE